MADGPPTALALGHGFMWSDLACYAVGVAAAALLDVALVGRRAARGVTASGATPGC